MCTYIYRVYLTRINSIFFTIFYSSFLCLCICLSLDKPTVSIRFEPPSPIIENDRVNVTLHCDVVHGNPRKLLKVQWMINGDVLTELPECNGTKIYPSIDLYHCIAFCVCMRAR